MLWLWRWHGHWWEGVEGIESSIAFSGDADGNTVEGRAIVKICTCGPHQRIGQARMDTIGRIDTAVADGIESFIAMEILGGTNQRL